MNAIVEEDAEFVYRNTELLWEKLKNKTIFITGATGFFGKNLLQVFAYGNTHLKTNIKILALSRDPETFIAKNSEFGTAGLHFLKGDIKDFIFPKEKIDFIIHAATDVNVTQNLVHANFIKNFDSIAFGTRHVLNLAVLNKVKSVLYISSGAVYGKQPSEISHVPEDFTGAPNVYADTAFYGEGKRVAEMCCNIYSKQHNLDIKIARCFSFIGPYFPLNDQFAIGNFLDDVLNKKPITIKGDGTPFRAYLYTADLVIWLLEILINGENCYPYNVGSDEGIDLKDLAKAVNTFSEIKSEIAILQPPTSHPPLRYVCSIDRAKNKLGLKVFTNLEKSIERTLNFYKIENTQTKKS